MPPRISEVAARFALDGMPGKQMAIDADLNAGLITQDQARRRREEVTEQADFYGAMDGASKFVRGDAIAGIVITVVNILAGLAIGVFKHGMDLSRAGRSLYHAHDRRRPCVAGAGLLDLARRRSHRHPHVDQKRSFHRILSSRCSAIRRRSVWLRSSWV